MEILILLGFIIYVSATVIFTDKLDNDEIQWFAKLIKWFKNL